MALTNFAALTDEQKTVWSRSVWRAARKQMFLNKFVGDDDTAMIQRVSELTKSEKGARAVLTLVADLEGDGTVGDRTLEGNEEALKSYDQVIQLDMLRHANRHEGRMADQRSVVNFRSNSKNVLAYWLADRVDQMAFLTLSGVNFTQATTGQARTGSDLSLLDFNPGSAGAPTTNRWRRWDDTGGLVAGATASVAAADTPSYEMLVEMRAYANRQLIRPIRGEGGVSLYHVFMSPEGIAKLKMESDFKTAVQHSRERAASNPFFKGFAGAIHVDGLMIHEYHHVFNTTGLTSGVDKWGSGSDVDGQRVLMCGSQAMGFADIGSPLWVEKKFDYDNQPGISVGKILGMLKPKYHSLVTGTTEDFGVLAVDTAI